MNILSGQKLIISHIVSNIYICIFNNKTIIIAGIWFEVNNTNDQKFFQCLSLLLLYHLITLVVSNKQSC